MQVSDSGFAGNSIDVNLEGVDAGNLIKIKLKGVMKIRLKGLIKISLTRVAKSLVNKFSWSFSKSKLLLSIIFANSIFDSEFSDRVDQQNFK